VMGAEETPTYKVIGRAVPRHDARDKVFGQTKYADDFVVPGTLIAKVLRSKYAAAKIVSIDTSKAAAVPGVHAVLTAKDVPHNETTSKFGQTHSAGGGFEGLYRVLADKKVRYMGEGVALVAAETLAQAEEAARAIEVVYDPQPGVFDPLEALKPDAYRVGEEDSNVVCAYKVRKGDVDAGFAQADVVVEGEYRVPFGDHVYLEPESGTAWIDEDGVLTIRASTQVIEHFRDIADIMGLPHNRVRVIAPMLGGGFGGKEDITVEAYLALLAHATKQPVRLTYTREESILAHSKRHPYVMRYKTGATRDGKLVALDAEIVSDAGGYPFLSPWVLLYSVVMATGPYVVPNVKVDAVSALTNNTFTSAYRGFGAPQVCFAYESQMDELAEKLGLTPLEFRMRNYMHTGDELGTGYALESAVLTDETARRAWEALGEPTQPRSPDEVIGRGIASGMQSYGRLVYLHDSSRAYVGFELDGTVVVRSGVQDIGGGQASSIAQISAEILGVPMEDITVYFGDTALTPLAGTTTATRMLYMSGNATLKAARTVREAIVAKASEMLEVDSEQIDLADRMVRVEGDEEKSIPIVDVVKACASQGIPISNLAQFNAPSRDLEKSDYVIGQIHPDYTFGTHAAEVAVDTKTGKVTVLKLVAAFDVGQSINKLSAQGQLEGGTVCGVGYALLEDVKMDHGRTVTCALDTYLVPTAADMPDVEPIMLESRGGMGPFGAKGIGEPASTSGAPAVTNAVADAIGIRLTELPLTPERILTAMKQRDGSAGKAVREAVGETA
jgi:CO/xanthine dehydrogenase Mo-binding subunit